jgi:ABC-type sugar transport system ATPase subunit
MKDLLAGKVGSHVVLGIRPEHFHVRQSESSVAISVKLNVVEPLGNDMDVYMSTALHDHVVGRIEAEGGLVMGSATTVFADVRKAHFFEPGVTGLNLSLSAPGGSSSKMAAGLKDQTHAFA